ncbi:MAG: PQQ-binding-like beta-propeller repeat protein [Phycisphaerae bacterium]|jgi:outer membrane protein assembly factor BamB|nr:PQQ-binding-like beta-propeller repeat protein [Phycisphaerae bacterium]
MNRTMSTVLTVLAIVSLVTIPAAGQTAKEIIDATGVKGGLIVHIGCRDGALTAALRMNKSYIVHGLATDPDSVDKARQAVMKTGRYGKVSIDRLPADNRLPYIDNTVNLVVGEDLGEIPVAEVMRVLCPKGVAYVKSGGKWSKTVKQRPRGIDEWTHYLYDPSNNAVAHDTVVGPPRRMQWVGSPRYARHHDRMSSVSAAVTSGGRVFYIFDEALPISILLPSKWAVIARDAFNGTVLWKRKIDKWHSQMWPLKSGPAQLPRRLVASGDRAYVTLSIDGPITALDAATGQTVREYESTRGAEEFILSKGVLVALVNKDPEMAVKTSRGGYGSKFWDEKPRDIVAVAADTGKVLWTSPSPVMPLTLSADAKRVVFHDGKTIVALDRTSGKVVWRSKDIARAKEIRGFYGPTLVLHKDVVLFSGGETAGKQTGSWYMKGKDTLTAVSIEDGKFLWDAYHPPSGYRSPEDLLVVDGLVWTGETTSGRATGVFTGRDPKTGKVKREFPPDVSVYWFHHRCYRGKATDNFLLMSRTGVEFIDVRKKSWNPNHWVRGACGYGVMPANGLLYSPQNPCACYLETRMTGFNALAPKGKTPRIAKNSIKDARLEKGPAYNQVKERRSKIDAKQDWPTYRHDAARSGRASTTTPAELKQVWDTELKGKLTSPVVADGRVFVATINTHTVHALDARSGKRLWSYQVGGRVDSPPTIHKGQVLFGSSDGWVYALQASDGKLAWRFRAASMDQRMMANGQIESVWPVHGSVLIRDDVLYCVSGRSMFLDEGLRFWRLDPVTGRVLSRTVLDEKEQETGKDLHEYVSWLNMPTGLPDILSSTGPLVYMRGQAFGLDGRRLPLKPFPRGANADAGAPEPVQTAEYSHLFSPTGFLDDAWWHRTYWMYGSMYVSGWCGYYRSGTAAPAGRIMAFDDEQIYGFGRKPQYYRWVTPIEHHLFATNKKNPQAGPGASARSKASIVRIAKSKSLNPANKPLTLEAWIKPSKPNGVVAARGGSGTGYALYIQGGRAKFAVRSGGKLVTISGKTKGPAKIVGRWTHVAGVLTAEKGMRIYVDGKLAGSGLAAAMITANPQEGMEIGADDATIVGNYSSAMPFTGLIDELRLHRRALDAAEIARRADAPGGPFGDEVKLVLACSFDAGKGSDASGNENHGAVTGGKFVAGKSGKAMEFSGGSIGGSGPVRGFKVKHVWSSDLPLFARAMILSDKILWVAGPADLVDEEKAVRALDAPETRTGLADQLAALEGKKGGHLWAVSTVDGEKLSELKLDSVPIFDGMAAAGGKLYMATVDGKVVCFDGK